MSFEDKYSWKILTQFSSVVESYYRLGLMDANKSQDVKAVNEIIERDVLKEKVSDLTRREMEVLKMIASGAFN